MPDTHSGHASAMPDTHGGHASAMPRTPRRIAIATAVIDLAARSGARAVTHSAVDRHLELPKGSTSYYYRTRADLIAAGIALIRAHSRESFEQRAGGGGDAVSEITAYVTSLLLHRRTEVRARLALLPELSADPPSDLFFSHRAARRLFERLGSADPQLAAQGLIDLLEGILLRVSWAPGEPGTEEQAHRGPLPRAPHQLHEPSDPAARIRFAVSAYLAGLPAHDPAAAGISDHGSR